MTRRGKMDGYGELVCSVLYIDMKDIDIALDMLTDREQEVLRMCFGIGMDSRYTQKEIGNHFGISSTRVHQIKAKALRKLRHPSRLKFIGKSNGRL